MKNKRNLTERQKIKLTQRKIKKTKKRLEKNNIFNISKHVDIEEIDEQVQAEIKTDKFVKNFVAQYVK